MRGGITAEDVQEPGAYSGCGEEFATICTTDRDEGPVFAEVSVVRTTNIFMMEGHLDPNAHRVHLGERKGYRIIMRE
jgi:hypothetical protein